MVETLSESFPRRRESRKTSVEVLSLDPVFAPLRVTQFGVEVVTIVQACPQGVRITQFGRGSSHVDLDYGSAERKSSCSSTDGFVQLSAKGVRMPLTQPMVEAYEPPPNCVVLTRYFYPPSERPDDQLRMQLQAAESVVSRYHRPTASVVSAGSLALFGGRSTG